MNQWKIVYTKYAERDLPDIYEYIAFSLLEPETANKQARRILESAAKLDAMPHRFSLYEREPRYSKGLRALPVDNYLVFYLAIEPLKTVAVIRIMYGGRDIDAQLRQT